MFHSPYAPTDWESAYSNAPNIPGGEDWPARWRAEARAARERFGDRGTEIGYGEGERERIDLFVPPGPPRGLVVFVHGGYWMRFDRTDWSHLARGPLHHGWAVAMPGYTLASQARIGEIARAVSRAVAVAAERIDGPIRLVGHSAGGQLVTRLVCGDGSPRLSRPLLDRVERVVSVSGVHDLRPLLRLALNETLRLDEEEARRESPALLSPHPGTELVAWVGQAERAEFVRQTELLANVWRGAGARTACVIEPDRHHFDVVEGLADPASPLCACVAQHAAGETRGHA